MDHSIKVLFYIAIEFLAFRCMLRGIIKSTKPNSIRRDCNYLAGVVVFIFISLMLLGYMFG